MSQRFPETPGLETPGPETSRLEASRREAAEAVSAALAHSWWAIALRGLAGVLFGLVALAAPGLSMLSLVLVFAAYMLADGVFNLVAAVQAARHNGHWGLMALIALADVAAGAVAVTWPAITVLAFVTLIAAWCVVGGLFALVGTFRLQRDHGRIWMGVGAVASIVFGVLLLIAPMMGAVVLTWWLGAYALVFGVSLVVLAIRLRPHRHDQAPHHAHPLSA